MLEYGPHLVMDLVGCNPLKLRDSRFIYSFMYELPSIIGMNKLSTPHIDLYNGKAYNLTGYSATIHIVESHITFHFFDWGFAFGDIFSCKEFDTELAKNWIWAQLEVDQHRAQWTKIDTANTQADEFLKNKKSVHNVYYRGGIFPHMIKTNDI